MDGDPFDLTEDVPDGQFRMDSFADEGDLSGVYKLRSTERDARHAGKGTKKAYKNRAQPSCRAGLDAPKSVSISLFRHWRHRARQAESRRIV